jgi:predicted transglutaminase-like cysteine proteinase
MLRITALLCLVVMLSASLAVAGVVDFSPGLLNFIASKWGRDAISRMQEWRDIELERVQVRLKSPSSTVLSKGDMQIFNAMWNKVPYYSDRKHWGVDDYWATPVEMLASNGGDCEDYSIAKYFSLKELGVPVERLRITYVRALQLNEAHMVLAYYPTPDGDPYILDNLTSKLVPASERPDLEPVYSFNDDDLWAAGASAFKGKSSQIRLWSDLQAKMEKERTM